MGDRRPPESRFGAGLERVRSFLLRDLWEVEVSSLPSLRAYGVNLLRVVHLVARGCRDDELPLRASALTFSTLMSLVPILAIAFSVLRGLGGSTQVDRLLEMTANMPDQFRQFVDQLVDLVNTTNYAALSGIGAAVLIVMVAQVLGSIEAAFNRVWGISTSRDLLRRIANYVSVLVVVPILLVSAGAISTALHVEKLLEHLGPAAHLYRSFVWPLVATWAGFSFLYVLMPNTRVQKKASLVSGLIGALLWLTWQKLYISVQFGVSRANAIYGTFASIPIFLAWLYMSWLIVLLGAEIAFAIQNYSTLVTERESSRASVKAKLLLALSVVTRAAEAMSGDRKPLNVTVFAREQGIPVRLVHEVTELLVRTGLLGRLEDDESTCVLLKAPDQMPVERVLDMVLADGAPPDRLGLQTLRPSVRDVLARSQQGSSGALADLTVLDLLAPQAGEEA